MKRAYPSSGTTLTSSCLALATQAGMSVLEPSSLDRTSKTLPTSDRRMAPIRAISGPGQAMPRASMDSVISIVAMLISVTSDEDDGAGGRSHERRHSLHAVHEWIQVVFGQLESLHREGAGLDVDLADVLRLGENLAPGGGVVLPHHLGRGRGGLRGQAMVLSGFTGSERVQGPVLEEDVHLAAHGRRAGGEYGCRAQFVVCP